ncbi:hypothetical protein HYPSUDRAFT_205807 [Hypholoma sublateritium FD-334 SS-4]|uniref:Uncharacterized protein n=1 Tax=Hypholoma sublateritium (strain FD-334 SS-4) TaxID=945553 RepID=A0A0D2M442_HYPSF|nr:hypothetical protein HYPSUDRAFT_205807 [Hypholoma sublateritium FD-334 SS-4]
MSTNTSNPRTIYVGAFVAFAVIATSVALLRVYYLRRGVSTRRVPLFVPQYPTRPSYPLHNLPPAPPYYTPPQQPYFPPYTPPDPYFPPSPSPSDHRVPKAKVKVPRRNPRNNMDGHDEPRPDIDGRGPSRPTIPTQPNDRREPAQPVNPPGGGSGPPPAYEMDGRD